MWLEAILSAEADPLSMGTARQHRPVLPAIGAALLLGLVVALNAIGVLRVDDRRIAFTSVSEGGCRVHTMSRDGAGKRRVTDSVSHSPSWSPDGRRIVFAGSSSRCCATDGGAIHVMDDDGSDVRQLTRGSFRDSEPAWSPDGRTIAFVRESADGSDVYVVHAEGGRPRRVTAMQASETNPAWSPDSRRIAFSRDSGIYVVRARGGSPWRLTADTLEGAGSPTWSPTGRWIAFVQDGAVYRVRANGTGKEQLFGADEELRDTAWSPDGREIAFVSIRRGGLVFSSYSAIYTLRVADGRLRRLTGYDCHSEPAWRPDPGN